MDEYTKTSTPECCAIYCQQGNSFERATASASHIKGRWFIDRVFVFPSLRGKGLGKRMVLDVLTMVKEQGGGLVQVVPGGYNMRYRDQKNFYEACGFAEVKPGLMETTVDGRSKNSPQA